MRLALTCLALSLVGATVQGQCPDGAPPPCGDRRQAAPLKRIDPPLDDKTWIVVPFNNVTRAPDVDYLRDASVNLLYLDLAKWTDIRVIDDARVTDLIREVPGAKATPVSLDAAMAMARRAGAGRLVMGNVIKQGSRTTIAAKVFDVKKGAVMRTPQQDLVSQDSLMVVFGRLAADILDVAPPAGVDIAGIGTTRVAAYQQYLDGITALKRFDLETARPHLERALAIDSNFALAHYSLAVLIGWENSADRGKVTHGDAANRLARAGNLPARERTLMKALAEFEHLDNAGACRDYGSLIHADSADIEALYGLGECTFHDQTIVQQQGDTARAALQANMNVALRAFRRVLELDPTYHLAVQHLIDAYEQDLRVGAQPSQCVNGVCPGYTTLYRANGDTVITETFSRADSARLRQRRVEYALAGVHRNNLRKAKEVAANWVATSPDESRAHLELAHAEVLLDEYAEAAEQLALVKGKLSETDMSKFYPDRLEVLLKGGRMAEFRRLADSVAAVASPSSQNAAYAAAFLGRTSVLESTLGELARSGRLSRDFMPSLITVFVSGGTPRTDSIEHRNADSLARAGIKVSPLQLLTIPYSVNRPRVWSLLGPPTSDLRDSALSAMATHDTARLRSSVARLDSLWRAQPSGVPDSGGGTFVAQLYLALGDSTRALDAVRRVLDTTLYHTPASQAAFAIPSPVLLLWPRLMLMRADLEAAVGEKPAARQWYQRFIDLWSTADPELMPMVDRAKREMARLRE